MCGQGFVNGGAYGRAPGHQVSKDHGVPEAGAGLHPFGRKRAFLAKPPLAAAMISAYISILPLEEYGTGLYRHKKWFERSYEICGEGR